MTEERKVTRREFLKGLGAGLAIGAIAGGGITAAVVPPRVEVVEKVVEKPVVVERVIEKPVGLTRTSLTLAEYMQPIPKPFTIWCIQAQCAGCHRCEIACSLKKEGKIWLEASRIRIFHFADGIEVIHLCKQCHDYPCIEACPVGILAKDEETGAVVLTDPEACLGRECAKCYDACPGKYPHFHPTEDYVLICDLCQGDPECVKECPNDVLKIMASYPSCHKVLADTPEEIAVLLYDSMLGIALKPEEVV